jgi:general secretion pathway protein G
MSVHYRRCRDRTFGQEGWTFVEAIVVIAIIVMLTGTVAFTAVRYVERARRASAQIQVESFGLALQAYYLDTGGFPTEFQGLGSLWSQPMIAPVTDRWAGPYVDRPIGDDPWGWPFDYRVPGPGGLPYEILCYGSDGLPGGDGSGADITSSR